MTRVFCSIYKSSKKDEMYLYVPRASGLKGVPEALMQLFGTPRHVSDMLLTADRPLARADVRQVLEKLADPGYYLQMPPPPEDWVLRHDQAPAWRRRSAAERAMDEGEENAT